MSRLIVIGDSYSFPIQQAHSLKNIDRKYNTNWIEILAKNLKVNSAEIRSNYGVSNEWIYDQFLDVKDKINPNDYIIVQTTSKSRHWFFEDSPQKSNVLETNTNDNFFTKAQADSITAYYRHLQNDNLDSIITKSILHSLSCYKNLGNILILPGWESVNDVQGNLTDSICDNEFDNMQTRSMFYNLHQYDPRLNHMIIDNHYVLADKILNYFIDSTPLDLTYGFKSNIFTKNNLTLE